MNNIRMILCGFAMISAICVNDIMGMYKDCDGGIGGKGTPWNPYGDYTRDGNPIKQQQFISNFVKQFPGGTFMWKNKGVFVTAILSSQLNQENDALNAAIDAAGIAGDKYFNYCENNSDNPQSGAIGFIFVCSGVINYGVRKGRRYIKNNGPCVNPLVSRTLEVTMQPQLLTCLILYCVGLPFF